MTITAENVIINAAQVKGAFGGGFDNSSFRAAIGAEGLDLTGSKYKTENQKYVNFTNWTTEKIGEMYPQGLNEEFFRDYKQAGSLAKLKRMAKYKTPEGQKKIADARQSVIASALGAFGHSAVQSILTTNSFNNPDYKKAEKDFKNALGDLYTGEEKKEFIKSIKKRAKETRSMVGPEQYLTTKNGSSILTESPVGLKNPLSPDTTIRGRTDFIGLREVQDAFDENKKHLKLTVGDFKFTNTDKIDPRYVYQVLGYQVALLQMLSNFDKLGITEKTTSNDLNDILRGKTKNDAVKKLLTQMGFYASEEAKNYNGNDLKSLKFAGQLVDDNFIETLYKFYSTYNGDYSQMRKNLEGKLFVDSLTSGARNLNFNLNDVPDYLVADMLSNGRTSPELQAVVKAMTTRKDYAFNKKGGQGTNNPQLAKYLKLYRQNKEYQLAMLGLQRKKNSLNPNDLLSGKVVDNRISELTQGATAGGFANNTQLDEQKALALKEITADVLAEKTRKIDYDYGDKFFNIQYAGSLEVEKAREKNLAHYESLLILKNKLETQIQQRNERNTKLRQNDPKYSLNNALNEQDALQLSDVNKELQNTD